MNITRGKLPGAKKIVVYGPEGIGKSTFASKFPDPVFIDTEGSTGAMDVARLDKPTSWNFLLEEIDYIKNTPGICKTLVIDTIDWAEMLCIEHICNKHQKNGIEDFGYGNGYVYTKEEFGRFLNRLSDVVEKRINVVLTAHAQIRKFEQPDEMGAYDRWELKLGKKTQSQTSPLVKEWADMLLFANYKTYSIAVDEKGKKHKAQGGSRVMYTAHHPCWDAKNRYGLPEEIPFAYQEIAHVIEETTRPLSQEAAPVPVSQNKAQHPATAKSKPENGEQMELPLNVPDAPAAERNTEDAAHALDPQIPQALRDLMTANQVDEWDIQNVVQARGYYPSDVPIRDYDEDFINGCLIGAWDQVYDIIKTMKEKQEIPFD